MRLFVQVGLLGFMASCTGPPFYEPGSFPPLSGVEEGATAAHVKDVLGQPDEIRNGWWLDGGVKYASNYQVWYYGGKGRVVFDGYDGTVVLSQADPNQPKHAGDDPYNGL